MTVEQSTDLRASQSQKNLRNGAYIIGGSIGVALVGKYMLAMGEAATAIYEGYVGGMGTYALLANGGTSALILAGGVEAGLYGASNVPVPLTGVGFAGMAEMAAVSGMKSGGVFVYRGLAKNENIAVGLFARSPGLGNSPISHVAGKAATQWISTTKSLSVAMNKFGEFGVVQINLAKVTTPIVDVSMGFFKRSQMSNWAKKDQEVLIQDFISPAAIERIQ